MYPNAHYWFIALLVLTFFGFWPSYFSPDASSATFAQHLHAVFMLIWVVMLIVQPWLIRTRRRALHRVIGRISLLVAPMVVISALIVVHDNLAGFPQPMPPRGLSFFWLGLASAIYYAIIYSLAIANRRDMQKHARYMAATVLAFIVPGLGRSLAQLLDISGLELPAFDIALWGPVVIGLIMIFHDVRNNRIRRPWILATVLSSIILAGFYVLPTMAWFESFANWYLSLA